MMSLESSGKRSRTSEAESISILMPLSLAVSRISSRISMSSAECAGQSRPIFWYSKGVGSSLAALSHFSTLAPAMSEAYFPRIPMAPMFRPEAS